MSKIKICSTVAELGEVSGGAILAAGAQAVKERGRFVVAFSGGSLPDIVGGHLLANKVSGINSVVVMAAVEWW